MNHMTDHRRNTSYRCSKFANGRACEYSNFMSVPKLELLTKKALENLVNNDCLTTYEYFVPKERKVNELEGLQSALKRIHTKLERHKEAYANGIDTIQEYKENKERCTKEESEIIKQIELFSDNSVSDEKIEALQQAVNQLIDLLYDDKYPIEYKSTAIKLVIDKIIFNKYTGEFNVYYFL